MRKTLQVGSNLRREPQPNQFYGIYTVQRPGHPPRQPVTVRQFLSWLELHDMKALPAEAERQQSDGEAARVLARFADMSRHELAVVMSGARLLWQEQADSA
jgi:hypothetical protein